LLLFKLLTSIGICFYRLKGLGRGTYNGPCEEGDFLAASDTKGLGEGYTDNAIDYVQDDGIDNAPNVA
jgi:hypothetical protein